MPTVNKILAEIMSGTKDNNMRFVELQKVLKVFGFECRIYWSNDDEKFIVEVPELAGCMADGKTASEALENAERVIDEWIETAQEIGRKIPEPKGKLMYA